MSPAVVLFFIFLVLKLASLVAWSWWFVTSPLWVAFGLWVVFVLIAVANDFPNQPRKG